MIVKFLSSIGYEDRSKNYGDCILIDNGLELVVYDCGSEEHAKRVEQYMKERNYSQAIVVLSHNDSDHFTGIPYLIDKGLVSQVYTLLLYKYKDEILDLVDDDRRNRDSIVSSIKELYDNIDSLSQKAELMDVFVDTEVANGISVVGPDKSYALASVAKAIDSRVCDTIDNETVMNAASTQLSVVISYDRKLLLTGDSSFDAIEESIKNHSAIQLPHHGKLKQADSIFAVKDNRTVYYVSDNTGDSNGGSDDLPKRGHVIHNTKDGDQTCDSLSFGSITPRGSYC